MADTQWKVIVTGESAVVSSKRTRYTSQTIKLVDDLLTFIRADGASFRLVFDAVDGEQIPSFIRED